MLQHIFSLIILLTVWPCIQFSNNVWFKSLSGRNCSNLTFYSSAGRTFQSLLCVARRPWKCLLCAPRGPKRFSFGDGARLVPGGAALAYGTSEAHGEGWCQCLQVSIVTLASCMGPSGMDVDPWTQSLIQAKDEWGTWLHLMPLTLQTRGQCPRQVHRGVLPWQALPWRSSGGAPSSARFPHASPGDESLPSAGKESACSAGDPSSIPGSGRSAGEGVGYPVQNSWASLVALLVKNPPAMQETWVRSLGWGGPLEKGKATHSSILAWRIPWTV